MVYLQMQLKHIIREATPYLKVGISTSAYLERYKRGNTLFKQLIYSQMQFNNTI